MRFFSVAAIFKNESHVLAEWIQHYLSEGAEHFYLIDNGSTDNYYSSIRKFADKFSLVFAPRPHAQVEHYNKYVLPRKNESEWIAVVDLDEFMYARNGFSTIADYLRTLPDNVVAVLVPWKMFGSSGLVQQPPRVVPYFTRRARMGASLPPYMRCVKAIVRTRALRAFRIHVHDIFFRDSEFATYPTRVPSEVSFLSQNPEFTYYNVSEKELAEHALHLNHYAVQSFEWFKAVKMTRGDAVSQPDDRMRNLSYFRKYDRNEVFDNELALKHSRLQSQP